MAGDSSKDARVGGSRAAGHVRNGSLAGVRLMRVEEAPVVARYHREHMPTAFLSTLGDRFLAHLYIALSRSRDAFVLVAVAENDHVLGFICGATSVKRVYRSVLLRRGWFYAGLLVKHMLSWSMLKRIVETLFYPSKLDNALPEAELLSVVVDPSAQGTGMAGTLLGALVEEFRQRRCATFKVLVGANLERANAYYLKHGFTLADTTQSHGVPSNIYTIATGLSADCAP